MASPGLGPGLRAAALQPSVDCGLLPFSAGIGLAAALSSARARPVQLPLPERLLWAGLGAERLACVSARALAVT